MFHQYPCPHCSTSWLVFLGLSCTPIPLKMEVMFWRASLLGPSLRYVRFMRFLRSAKVVRGFFVFAILFHYPVVHFTFRSTIEKVIFANYDFNWIRHTIETIVIISATLIWSILFPSLQDVFSLTGGIVGELSWRFRFPCCFSNLLHPPCSLLCPAGSL